jgi:signal transduction histidine kinase
MLASHNGQKEHVGQSSRIDARVPADSGHAVLFYESDPFLAGAVADFLETGISTGESLIVIAMPAHREAICGRLASRGVDLGAICASGQLTVLDATEMLSTISVDAAVNPQRFLAAIGGVLRRSRCRAPDGVVRVYGEMVAELWSRGDYQGAVQLEHLWNGLAREETFSLLCAYPMHAFDQAGHGDVFRDICGAHTHVRPTERYTEVGDDARMREISVLQQRAQALEAEINRRRDLERQLRGALADAEMANRAKGEFLAAMSHELRTPLNAIAGYADLLELEIHGPVTKVQREYLGRIRASQQYLLSLINDVLNFAKVEAGRIEFDMQAISVDCACRELEMLLAPQLAEKQLDYAYRPGDSAWHVDADAEKVRQIMLNLLSNAIKYTDGGGRIALSVTASADDADDHPVVHIRVSDTGIGIAEHQQAAIFEPFVQVGRRLSAPHEGVGLGLAISRELARRMRGDLTVESTPGAGSTFTLTLRRSA